MRSKIAAATEKAKISGITKTKRNTKREKKLIDEILFRKVKSYMQSNYNKHIFLKIIEINFHCIYAVCAQKKKKRALRNDPRVNNTKPIL